MAFAFVLQHDIRTTMLIATGTDLPTFTALDHTEAWVRDRNRPAL